MVVPIVPTASGKVRGTVQYTNDLPDKPVYTFKGIPYAAPPFGDLRFRAPQPAAPWEGVRDATELGPYCPQDQDAFNFYPLQLKHYKFDEDCLTVNIETPTLTKDAGLPVLLWIHGGGFVSGLGHQVPFLSLAAHQDVIVVTFNYRLGALGFLSTGDENAPGNVAFLDQIQAMVWVQQNIRNFGGDPDRVTLFGLSAGGTSVCYHLVSPLSKGLFQRAISQSGVCQTLDVVSNPLDRAVMLAKELGCDTKDTASMVAGLREKPVDQIVACSQRLLMKLGAKGELLAFGPVVDGRFLAAHPSDIFDLKRAHTVDYLLGVGNHEYGFQLPSQYIRGFGRGITEDRFLLRMKKRMNAVYPKSNLNNIAAAIRRVYREEYNPDDPHALEYQFTHAFGDQMFVAPTVLVASKHAAAGQRVYLYENQYAPSSAAAIRPDWVGCDHSDEAMMVSGAAFLDVPLKVGALLPFCSDDKRTSLSMMAYWANFARTGNPSDRTGGPADSPMVPEWPQYTPDNPAYMKLDVTSSSDVGLKPEKMRLWNDVIPKLAASSKMSVATMVVPIVSTASGKVRGTVQYTNDLPDKPIYTFKGIPYAAPPVGDLRFRAPQSAAPWEGVRDATELGPYCPQDTTFLNSMVVKQEHYNLDEDCLSLNVETPTIAKDAGLPVLLWIHGGGLYTGSGYFLPYTSLAAHQQVVVVTFNYRLGVLGFFSTGDQNAPGNFGFLDQIQAMRWVQENIRNFGGDPDRVTIFGESAGGASVCYHVVSPLSKGLFQRAISQSGVCQTCGTFPKPLERAVMLAEELGCDTRDTANMVACLRQKSADELNSGTLEVMKKLARQGASVPSQPFSPAVDGHFLPAEPTVLFDTGRANAVDYLLGVNNHEYGFLLPLTMILGYGRGMTEDKYLSRMKRMTGALYPGSNQNNIVAEIRKLYRGCFSGDDPMSIQYQFTHACGDHVFVAPTVLVADKHSACGQKVYLYENHYTPSRFSAGRPDWVGCDHGDELFVMSGVAFLNVPMTSGRLLRFSADDKKASLDMMAYWANFARTGNPSDRTGGPADSPTVPEWPQYTPDNPAYMKLDLTSSSDVGLHPDRMALWNDVIPKLASSSKL
ncbi:uncharacterized protein LOC118418078 [Branchiostoma floridae]|uniref:Uncharacterized protein LOC118418078 n=1 Tax=Branchiostoma floridae TaxID=7739 RepID=A0A9J7LD38_BRAFL|nr:uncharacterized protein LOC118418078 [Branchiostoma floridae]